MKGVSTVIATLLMLIITIALAGLAYTYISGVFTAKTAIILNFDEALTTCSGTTITPYVRNDGTVSITLDKVTISGKKGNGTAITATVCGAATANLGTGVSVQCAAVTGSAGSNQLIVTAPAATSGRASIYCAG